jgi:DNA-binding NtrC family response regulator
MLKGKILIIDDNVNLLESLRLYFLEKNYEVFVAKTGINGLEILSKQSPHIAIVDIKLPDIDGLKLIEQAKSLNISTKFITITAYQDMETTVRSIKLGAVDYIQKPVDIENLNKIVEKSLKNEVKYEYLTIKEQYYKKDAIIGKSKCMQEIFKIIGLLSEIKTNVLITGESGTGKELIARAIHYYSKFSEEPFIGINCSAIVENLWESELFGHERGSFTGANSRKIGKLEAAKNGTVFLDEIGELPLNVQPKLLRVLQEREFERVGSVEKIKMSARIIAATNRNLDEMVKKGKFRKDLYYRLKVFEIEVPSLRERKEDIPLLVDYLIKKISNETGKKILKVPIKIIKMFQEYHWPGNVRELENVLTRAVILSKSDTLEENFISGLLNIDPEKNIFSDNESFF